MPNKKSKYHNPDTVTRKLLSQPYIKLYYKSVTNSKCREKISAFLVTYIKSSP